MALSALGERTLVTTVLLLPVIFVVYLLLLTHRTYRFTLRQGYQHATGLLQAFVHHKHYLIRSQR